MTKFNNVKDDGHARKVESTGAVREIAEGKGRFDLIPPYPLLRLAQHYENGAKKYAPNNWTKGLPLWRFLDSATRHMNSYRDGDTSEDHMAAAIWNLFGYVHTKREIEMGRLPLSLAEDATWEKDLMQRIAAELAKVPDQEIDQDVEQG